MENHKQLVALNELIGSIIVPTLQDSDIKALETDASSFLKSRIDFDFDGNVSFAENTDKEVHLALPYYTGIEKISSVELTSDQMEEVHGGEIFVTLASFIGISAGVAAGAAAAAGVGVGIAAGAKAFEGKNLDGSKK